jgi:hypothetical protein
MILKLERNYDLQKLRSLVFAAEAFGPPYLKNRGFWGGWSLTSSNGDVYDGWQSGEKMFDRNVSDEEQLRILSGFLDRRFNTKTPIYDDYIDSIVSDLAAAHVSVERIRLVVLVPHPETAAYWHQDSTPPRHLFKLRLHVPIITNDRCFFEYKDKRVHLPADGSAYVIDVGVPHRVLNLSGENRYHLMMDLVSG